MAKQAKLGMLYRFDTSPKAVGPKNGTKFSLEELQGFVGGPIEYIYINKLNRIDDMAKQVGGVFNDDITVLARYANVLDDRFGAVAKTSFAGQTTQGVRRAQQAVTTTGQVQLVGEVVEAAAKRFKTDDRALAAIRALLREKRPTD